MGDIMAEGKFRFDAGDWHTDHLTVIKKKIDQNSPLHMHSFYEIELVTDGTGETNFNGKTYKLQKGSLMFLTPIDFHSVECRGELELINLSFDEMVINPGFQNLFMCSGNSVVFELCDGEREKITSFLSQLETELAVRDEFSNREIENILNTVLVFIARRLRGSSGALPSAAITPIQASIRFLFKNFRENITLSSVAEKSGYTPNYFSKRFRELTGTTYIEFLNRLRTNYARMLLASTEYTVLEIAAESGFDSLSNFLRVFKEQTGTTPAFYRKSSRTVWK